MCYKRGLTHGNMDPKKLDLALVGNVRGGGLAANKVHGFSSRKLQPVFQENLPILEFDQCQRT